MRAHRLLLLCLVLLPLAAGVPTAARAAAPDRDGRLVETYQGILRGEPDDAYAFRRLLEVSHAVGGLVGLLQHYDAETRAHPKRVSAWMVLGHLHRAAEHADDAAAAYDRAAELAPKASGPHLARAELFRRLRRWDEAFAAYDAGVPLVRERAAKQDALRAAAEAAIEADRAALAERYFEALIKTEPSNLFLRMQQAGTLARMDQPERALAAWIDLEERARGQLDHLVTIWKEVAELQLRLRQLDASEATWRRALAKTPRGHWARQTFNEGLIGVYRRQDRLSELIQELTPEAKRSHEMRLMLARLYEELADDDQALKLYTEAVAARPRDQQARLAQLRLLERIGTPDQVIGAYQDLIRASPGAQRHEIRLAELFFQHGRRKDGYALIEQISRRYPYDPGIHQRVVDLWMRYGEASTRRKVEGEYKILMRLEPREESHVVSLGEYYWTIDDRQRALATWKRLLKLGRTPAEGHFLLGEVYRDHDLAKDALDQYARATELAPDDERFGKAYATALETQGRQRDALAQWRRLLELNAGRRSGLVKREAREHIIALWERGRSLDAEVQKLEARFAAAPPDASAGHFLAEAYIQLRRFADARRVLERLREIEAESSEGIVDTLTALEKVYTRQNAIDLAIAVLEELAERDSRSAALYLHRAADLALSVGDDRLALRYAREVVEKSPADPDAHSRVGDLYARMGYRAEAAEAWRQSLVLRPRNYPVRFKLATLYRQMGKLLREEQVLAEIVREASEPGDVQRAGRRLLQLAVATGRLEQVEDVFRPLVTAGNGRGVYLKLLVDLYSRLAQQVRYAAGASHAERAERLSAIGDRGLKPLLDAIADNDVAIRSQALDVLELTHPAAAAPALARLTQESDSLAQVQAAVILGKIGTSSAVAALARMNSSTKKTTSEIATWALGLISSEDAVGVLAQRAERARGRERQIVAAALGHSRHPAGYPAALALARDPNAEIRRLGLWALGRIANPTAVPLLRDVAMRGKQPEATVATWALGQIGTGAARDALTGLLWLRADLPEAAVWRALSAAPHPADERFVAAAYERLLNRDRAFVVPPKEALYEVPSTADPARTPASLLQGDRSRIRSRVDSILRQRARQQTQLLLGRLVAGDAPTLVPTSDVAEHAAAAAVTATLLSERWPQLAALATPSAGDTIYGHALEVLTRLRRAAPSAERDEQLRTLSLAALRDGGPNAHLGALHGIAATTVEGDPGVGDVLQRWIARGVEGDHQVPLRVALARVLGRLGGPMATAVLGDLLRDTFAVVRSSAAAAVADGRVDLAPLLTPLADLLDDPVPVVALAAVEALGARRDPRASALLQSVAAYGPPRLKRAAQAALLKRNESP